MRIDDEARAVVRMQRSRGIADGGHLVVIESNNCYWRHAPSP
jgi:hypothetical protein